MYIHDVIHKPEVHSVSPEEDRATAISNVHKNLVKIGRELREIRSRTDRQTDRQTDTVITILCCCPMGDGVIMAKVRLYLRGFLSQPVYLGR